MNVTSSSSHRRALAFFQDPIKKKAAFALSGGNTENPSLQFAEAERRIHDKIYTTSPSLLSYYFVSIC
ncbi:hypothetical protein BT93_F2695 [Corymbia citriodora subsp. variegata]|nr:hypothetical protein BT93_F2695 [Corymbia citriodora subsp. variegata]